MTGTPDSISAAMVTAPGATVRIRAVIVGTPDSIAAAAPGGVVRIDTDPCATVRMRAVIVGTPDSIAAAIDTGEPMRAPLSRG